jgi:putative ABC transport system ATP-binding protein
MLEIKNACKTFLKGTANEHVALDDVSLTLSDGEFVTIIGSNGAGKSTLFNAVSGTFLLDAGSVILEGEDITFMPEHKRAAVIGRLFQDPMKGTAPNMTIEENLALAYSRSHRHPLSRAVRKRDADAFREGLKQFGMGLEDRLRTRVGLLSGGQRQAMTLMMATIAQPELLLLDEHTAALDPATAEKVLGITRDIVARDKLTAMMVTHDIRSALAMGNRTIMMDSGEIILDISGAEREGMTVEALLKMNKVKRGGALANDRMLLAK